MSGKRAIAAVAGVVVGLGLVSAAIAHDTWVATNTNLVRTGDVVHVDLCLGNHGNEHRDFKLSGRIDLERCTLEVVDPAGKSHDLKATLVDTAAHPKEGYWTGRYQTVVDGLHTVVHTVKGQHQTKRTFKSGKAYFVASRSLDAVPSTTAVAFSKPLGHVFELVPQVNPVTPMGVGSALKVQLWLKGEPLANARISFIPRGQALAEGIDETYERTTDAQGFATFTPNEANYYLVVAHHATDERGEGFDRTTYSATLTVYVPQISAGAKAP